MANKDSAEGSSYYDTRGAEGVPSDSQRSVRPGDPGGLVSEEQKRYSIILVAIMRGAHGLYNEG